MTMTIQTPMTDNSVRDLLAELANEDTAIIDGAFSVVFEDAESNTLGFTVDVKDLATAALERIKVLEAENEGCAGCDDLIVRIEKLKREVETDIRKTGGNWRLEAALVAADAG